MSVSPAGDGRNDHIAARGCEEWIEEGDMARPCPNEPLPSTRRCSVHTAPERPAATCPGPNGQGCDCTANGSDPYCPWQPTSPERPAASVPDDTLGVIWDVPKALGGGYFTEAICWVDGCKWRWTSDRREEAEAEMARHQREVHGV